MGLSFITMKRLTSDCLMHTKVIKVKDGKCLHVCESRAQHMT